MMRRILPWLVGAGMAVGAFASRGAVVSVAPESLYEHPSDPKTHEAASSHPIELPHAVSDAPQSGAARSSVAEPPRSPLDPATIPPSLVSHDLLTPSDKSDAWARHADKAATVAAATPAPTPMLAIGEPTGVITSANNTPEPGSATLLTLAAAGAMLRRRRR